MRVRFTREDDLNLLKEVFAENPFEQTSRWRTIATNVGDALVPTKTFSVRAVRERRDDLIAYFKARDEANLKNTSGAASVEPPPETAEDIFEGLYDDAPELPHCGDESELASYKNSPTVQMSVAQARRSRIRHTGTRHPGSKLATAFRARADHERRHGRPTRSATRHRGLPCRRASSSWSARALTTCAISSYKLRCNFASADVSDIIIKYCE
ncbi:hypothetical protein HPB49_015791 [Dermacentor silvarum]|uniref:Uncharacterized protein n=1 Tax=Dermacentor silvarum TaxID=543639 RepID=A0ACB8CA22_DERSI|nr:hypothetical protein HPB49_015791 [Dermacentor silvarum]